MRPDYKQEAIDDGYTLAVAEVYLGNHSPHIEFAQCDHASDPLTIDQAEKIVDCYSAAIKVAKAARP